MRPAGPIERADSPQAKLASDRARLENLQRRLQNPNLKPEDRTKLQRAVLLQKGAIGLLECKFAPNRDPTLETL